MEYESYSDYRGTKLVDSGSCKHLKREYEEYLFLSLTEEELETIADGKVDGVLFEGDRGEALLLVGLEDSIEKARENRGLE